MTRVVLIALVLLAAGFAFAGQGGPPKAVAPDRWCFREDFGTEPFDNAAPGEMKPKLGPERCFVRTR